MFQHTILPLLNIIHQHLISNTFFIAIISVFLFSFIFIYFFYIIMWIPEILFGYILEQTVCLYPVESMPGLFISLFVFSFFINLFFKKSFLSFFIMYFDTIYLYYYMDTIDILLRHIL